MCTPRESRAMGRGKTKWEVVLRGSEVNETTSEVNLSGTEGRRVGSAVAESVKSVLKSRTSGVFGR